ncbi:MAG TPA: hypothetical protein V6C64_15580 [Microcoleaceae cyanobacterium]
MPESFLVLERERLTRLIQQLHDSGEVAPPYCWLTETSSKKGTKTYTYVILVTQPPECKPKSHSLGRPGSARHCHWRQAIARREAIVELEQQLTMLEVLIERQLRTWQDIHLLVAFSTGQPGENIGMTSVDPEAEFAAH